MPLTLTAAQIAQLATQDANLQTIFAEGSNAGLGPIEDYTELSAEHQQLTKDTFKQALAAFMAALGLPGLTVTVDYRKSDGTTNGTLTFTNGILTGST